MISELRHSSENPIPANATCGTFRASDGVNIRYAIFPAPRPIGTALLLQGRNEMIEKYFETASSLNAAGYTVVTLDWRGQGGSARLLRNPSLGHVENYTQYTDDLGIFFREVALPDCPPPFSILAHSMGALIALHAAPYLINRVHRMVLMAPLLALKDQRQERRSNFVSKLFCALGLGRRRLPGQHSAYRRQEFATNKATHDPVRFERNAELMRDNPDLCVPDMTARWARATGNATAIVQSPEFMRSHRVPTLFLLGGSDAIVSTPRVEHYARRLRLGHCLTINGAGHELLSEVDIIREQALAAFIAFTRSDSIEAMLISSEPSKMDMSLPQD